MPSAPPDFVIGVDFGMTQTGVAYAKAPWTVHTVRTFQHWKPAVSEISNKVPTRIGYCEDTGQLRSWGFGCDYRDANVQVNELFKLALDPAYRDEWSTHDQAKEYYREYLASIRQHVVRHFRKSYPNWEHSRVEWLFSVPTTWRNPSLVNTLGSVIRLAGYGDEHDYHRSQITLTEAEAAAIFVAHQHMKKNDVILVCDAGGGTTDINILKVASHMHEPQKLIPLMKVEGRPIGSAHIDMKIQQILSVRLRHIEDRLPSSPEKTAEIMMFEKFEHFKCLLGSGDINTPRLFLDVPGLPHGTDIPGLGIYDSQIAISRDEIMEIFDVQVERLITLVDEQIEFLQRREPGERINYLVMSGGFGSSTYLQRRLEAHFHSGNGSRLPNATQMKLLTADEPQLSVVHGLVLDRVQQLNYNVAPFENRCARVNYGMVVRQLYNQDRHVGEKVIRDTLDGRRWAENQIEWLISEGDKLSRNGVSKHVEAKITSEQARRPWKAQFVWSAESNVENRARSVPSENVKDLFVVEISLLQVKTKVKNDHWWNLGKRYHLAQFEIRLIPGSADLKIEILNMGRLVSTGDDTVQVQWESPKVGLI